ncbi:MAG: UvrD-helicase domain-containing protein [Opitutaceae bacterium]|nr:UvrD-helicase domain-containing protein [Opitutaceae bacterium]
MRFYADLHIHSKYSRATSGDLDFHHLALWAKKKGVAVVGTGDFTHPAWMASIKEELIPAEPGLFRLRDDREAAVNAELGPCAAAAAPVRFLLEVEISTIYKQGDKVRKVHHLLYAPDLAAADRMVARLARIGNLASDGRPILGLNSRDLLEICLSAGDGCFLIPAHIWTPWFSVFGSKSGFDVFEDCYGDLSRHIFAVETGLSSDPPMNWRLSMLDRFRLVSNSDAHSPGNLGREACRFDCALDYFAIKNALATGAGYGGTIEFYPEEGKYHLDGHRACGFRCEPAESRRLGNQCPVCGAPLTIGVLSRVLELADRTGEKPPPAAAPFRSLVPLAEMLGEIARTGPKSKAVQGSYEQLIARLGPELAILGDAPLDEIGRVATPLLVEAVRRLRAGRVIREGGYDGEYGAIRLFQPDELEGGKSISLLFELPRAETSQKHAKKAEAGKSGRRAAEPEASRVEEEDPFPFVASATSGAGPSILSGLDSDQRAAAEIVSGPLLIVAGPGTGKTRTLTRRIAHLIADHGAAPGACLAITFTRRAAGEMRERLTALLPDGRGAQVPVMTFHALGLAILREQEGRLGLGAPLRVAGEAEALAVAREALDVPAVEARRLTADPVTRPEAYVHALHAHGLVDFTDLIVLPVELLAAHPDLAAHYRAQWPHLSVDEYQDIDERQYRLVRLLSSAATGLDSFACRSGPPPSLKPRRTGARELSSVVLAREDGAEEIIACKQAPTSPVADVVSRCSLCVIGDPDQAIYGFRGTDVRFFQQFQSDYPAARVVSLTRNYRSTRTIVDAALQAVAPTTLVRDRVLRTRTADASSAAAARASRIVLRECATERAEAEIVVAAIERLVGGTSLTSFDTGRASGATVPAYAFNDFAVLYRTDAQTPPLIEAFTRSGIPFQKRTHGPLAEHPAVRALLACLKTLPADAPLADRFATAAAQLAREENADPDLRVITDALRPLAGRPGASLDGFVSELALGVDVDLHDPRAERVSLLTLHAAKGLEFRVVFLVGCEDGLLPHRFGADDIGEADVAEERRLFFVGLTRARERLFLTHTRRRYWQGGLRDRFPSPFLQAIRAALLERQKDEIPAAPRPRQLDLF